MVQIYGKGNAQSAKGEDLNLGGYAMKQSTIEFSSQIISN